MRTTHVELGLDDAISLVFYTCGGSVVIVTLGTTEVDRALPSTATLIYYPSNASNTRPSIRTSAVF
jgi:hypothetical protein